LIKEKAAIMIADVSAENSLIDVAMATIHNESQLKELSENIAKMSIPDSANRIIDEVMKIVTKKEA